MTEEVLISVKGLHTLEDTQKDEVEVISAGKYYKRNGKHYVLFEETVEGSGVEAGRQILQEFPDMKILFLTTFSDKEYIVEALSMGAKGYLIKQNTETVAPALRAVMSGQNVFGDEIVTKLPGLMSRKEDGGGNVPYTLKPRELEIISLVAEGLSNREISGRLYLSEGTVRNYLSTILEKLELRDRTQLAVFYYKKLKNGMSVNQ